MKILVVDDDPKLRNLIGDGLAAKGHAPTLAGGVKPALEELAAGHDFELILLDVMMPEATGWDLIEELRGRGDRTPVIFVTAKGSVEDRVRGLTLGGDDYIIKPFAFEELIARVEVVARRHSQLGQSGPVTFGNLIIDPLLRRVEIDGRAVEFSPREYALLMALIGADGEVLDRTELLRQVWNIEFDPGTNVVDVHIARARRRLGEGGRAHIQTVTGQGYRFVKDPD